MIVAVHFKIIASYFFPFTFFTSILFLAFLQSIDLILKSFFVTSLWTSCRLFLIKLMNIWIYIIYIGVFAICINVNIDIVFCIFPRFCFIKTVSLAFKFIHACLMRFGSIYAWFLFIDTILIIFLLSTPYYFIIFLLI